MKTLFTLALYFTGDFITKWKKDFKYPRGITSNRANQVLVVDCHLHRVSIHDPETGAYQGYSQTYIL